ncbi:gluconokinase [Sphingomonas sp. NFR15]|uniref:gluconokinase n=1 Tax=Sphingomonas sp. NFR15 TaxID=1566282 RepID=UPI0008821C1C|nr:gluconokinase [Sphingomonas sp. NFR15]SDA36833.1 gluconokinase [Sphingomonas sp. NFR15]
MAIIVMGVSGSGKSTLGASLAEALGAAFIEGDAFHDAAAVAKMRAGHPLTDADRWPWLDRLGAAIGAELRANDLVVAACSALRRCYRDRLVRAIDGPTRFILLAGGADDLRERVARRAGHYMPSSLLDSQLATLEPPLPDEAATTLDAAAPPDALRDAALAWLEAEGAAEAARYTGGAGG